MSKVRKLTRLKLINFDELSEEDVKTGKDFIITNYLNNLESVVKRKSKQKMVVIVVILTVVFIQTTMV